MNFLRKSAFTASELATPVASGRRFPGSSATTDSLCKEVKLGRNSYQGVGILLCESGWHLAAGADGAN
jgi:hypothetical protein